MTGGFNAPGIVTQRDRRVPNISEWRPILAPYAEPVLWRSLLQLAVNLLGYWLTLLLAVRLAENHLALSLALAIPGAGFTLRLFSIQHDCGHRAFLRSPQANDWLGRLLSPMTLTPYRFWQLSHARHHGSVGNLDRQGFGDIGVITVRDYRSRSLQGRLRYRLYRHPLILFGMAPAFLYYLRFRLPYGLPSPRWRSLASVLLLDLALVLIAISIEITIGLHRFLSGFLPMTTLAATVGVWLFYVHHDFEGTHWVRDSDWRQLDAQVAGTSFYALPSLLTAYTGNTGIHHIHHVVPRIPNYRLPECLRDHGWLRRVNPVSLVESLRCASLALWDEDRRRLISFREERSTRLRDPMQQALLR